MARLNNIYQRIASSLAGRAVPNQMNRAALPQQQFMSRLPDMSMRGRLQPGQDLFRSARDFFRQNPGMNPDPGMNLNQGQGFGPPIQRYIPGMNQPQQPMQQAQPMQPMQPAGPPPPPSMGERNYSQLGYLQEADPASLSARQQNRQNFLQNQYNNMMGQTMGQPAFNQANKLAAMQPADMTARQQARQGFLARRANAARRTVSGGAY